MNFPQMSIGHVGFGVSLLRCKGFWGDSLPHPVDLTRTTGKSECR
jgi:hypothetical protein